MHTQPTPSLETWPEEAVAHNGVVVASGYGLRINVWRGRLRVDDGIGSNRRSRLFHRATSGLTRLVVLGHTGYVSLEALRWLADVKAAYLQIDADGRVLATFGPPGTDRPALRRAQALAAQTETGLALSRWLVDAKLAGQLAAVRKFASLTWVDEAVEAIASYRSAVADAQTMDEMRLVEAWAAGAYWQALAPLQVRFARRDEGRVPTHWHTLGGRSSPLASGPRLAVNPANAVLNYLYALLESEATLAPRTVGLDPGLGVMHVDQVYRDSLASDLMEPVRPAVDVHAVELLTSRLFAARDFFETRTGVCRVTPPLSHELAATISRWRQMVGRVAEDFAARLSPSGREPGRTPISGRRRATGRPTGPRANPQAKAPKIRACSWCGAQTGSSRQTCSEACRRKVQEQTQELFVAANAELQSKRWAAGAHPAHTAEARRKLSTTQKARRAAEAAWDQRHPEPADREWFAGEVVPKLASVSAGQMARATGLSVGYCAEIKRGDRVPHPRWWEPLMGIAWGAGRATETRSGEAVRASNASSAVALAGHPDGRSPA